MISGRLTPDGVPLIPLEIAGRTLSAVVDTGFNGDLELPELVQPLTNARFIGRMVSLLAAGQTIEQSRYLLDVTFDGQPLTVEVTFAPGDEALVGTHLLHAHRLTIDFSAGTVRLERA